MKKLTLTMLSCIFISLIILSCRKEIFSEQFDNDTFFSYSTSDKMIAWAANSLKAQNATVKFAEEMQAKFGMPAWDNSLAFNDDAGMATVITPFTDEDEKQVTAIWIIYYQNGQLNTKIITRDDVRKLKIEKPDTKADANDYAIMFGYLESKIFNTGVKAVPSDNAVADSVAARQRAVEGWVTIEICTSYYQYAMVNGEYIPGTHQYTGTRCFTQTTWVPDAQPPYTPSYPSTSPPSGAPAGGGGSTTPIDTANKVKNPCIRAGLDLALGKNVNSKIKSLMVNTFMQNKSINLDFESFPFNPSGPNASADAYARPWSGTNTLSQIIAFNETKLPFKSKEYIVATVYHEVLHAYLSNLFPKDQEGKILIPDDHEYMINNYITLMSNDLRAQFPSLSETDAWALAWGGLEKTSRYSLLSSATKNTIAQINLQYSTKPGTNPNVTSKGSYCP